MEELKGEEGKVDIICVPLKRSKKTHECAAARTKSKGCCFPSMSFDTLCIICFPNFNFQSSVLGFQSSFRCPVILSSSFTGAGPIAKTVREPAAICVRPASST